jgi:hypothetical protein
MTSDINTTGALVLGVAQQMATPIFVSDSKDSITLKWKGIEDAFFYKVTWLREGETVYTTLLEETNKLGYSMNNLPLLHDPKGPGFNLYKFKV